MSRRVELQIRTMRREEVAFAIDLAAQEGWNPGLHDAECFFSADPEGFLIGEMDGEPVGATATGCGSGGPPWPDFKDMTWDSTAS